VFTLGLKVLRLSIRDSRRATAARAAGEELKYLCPYLVRPCWGIVHPACRADV
jgi:hypothetical protein